MKANTPEKIYGESDGLGNIVKVHNIKWPDGEAENIEYTRTDAFIEKACEYFRNSLEDVKVMDDYRDIAVRGIQASYTSVEEFVEGFRNYIEGA